MATTARYISTTDTAKLIRATLAQRFPWVKFSVRSSTYSGGSSIRVNWTDGPTVALVDRAVKHYAGASFDPSIDLKSYHTSTLNGERVKYGADFVFTERRVTLETFTIAVRMVCREHNLPVPPIEVKSWGPEIPYGTPGISGDQYGYWSMAAMVDRQLATLAIDKQGNPIIIKEEATV